MATKDQASRGEIVTQEDQTPAQFNDDVVLPANVADDDFFSNAGGLDNVTQEDLILPRYTLLQGLSPQINKRKDEYVEGAEIGMVFNTASGRVHNDLDLIMAAYERRYIEWIPRDRPCPIPGLPQPTGGGLYKDYGTDPAIMNEVVRSEENGSLWTPRGHELVVTGTWYTVEPDTLSLGFIAMGKTQFTPSKKLMAAIRDERVLHKGRMVQAPLYYRAWNMSSRLRSDGENEWFVWQHKPSQTMLNYPHAADIWNAVKSVHETLEEGNVIIDVASMEDEGQGRSSGSSNSDDARM